VPVVLVVPVVPVVWASASVDGTAKPNAAANPRRETIFRREIISHSSLIIFNLLEFDRTSRSATTSDQPEKFSSVFASDIDLNQKSGRDAYGHVVRAKSFSAAFTRSSNPPKSRFC
jgi:hypothetical protein